MSKLKKILAHIDIVEMAETYIKIFCFTSAQDESYLILELRNRDISR